MDSSQNLNIEPNESLGPNNSIINGNIDQHMQNINIPLPNRHDAQITTTVQEVRQIIKKENDISGINKIEEIDYQLNSVPFKSLIQDKTYTSSPLNELNNNNVYKENTINPFSKKEMTHEVNEVHYMSNKKNENRNENRFRSQNNEKIINVFPTGTFKIEVIKSRPKSRKTINNYNNIINNKNNVLNLNNVIKEENDHYKLLIKKIASQLKKRRNPPTKGIFYMTIIKTETYLKKVRKIGKSMKIKIRPPTHGFFFNIIKKEQYKLLVKRIASQLKKRIRFPTCKIIKIYEPYRRLIKKISDQLKISRNKRMMENNIIHENNVKIINTSNNNYEKIEIDEEHKDSHGNMNVFQGNKNTIINNKVDVDAISNNACKVIREGKVVKSYPSLSKPGKNVNIGMSFIHKENNLKLSEDKIRRNSLNEISDNINSGIDEELNNSRDLNISLSNIEVSKSNNFIQDFDKFLNKRNIKIINNFPVSLEEKNKVIFKQSNFWFLIFNYLFYQSNCISLFTIISILEQYFIWCTDKNLENFYSIKELIKEYINKYYTPEMISQFLFMNQLSSIDQIFQKYEISIKNNENNFQEIKLNNINIDKKCQCELCTNNEACIKKVSDDNKKKIRVIKNDFINYLGLQNGEKSTERTNDIYNNEELFFKGKSKKNVFSKSKIVQSESTNLEYNNIIEKTNKEEIYENDGEKNYRNISKKKERKKKDEIESDKEKEDNDEEDKNKKKGKKRKKTKSKNKNKEKEKKNKKRDSSNSDKIEEEEEEKEKEKEKEKEEVKSKTRSKSKSRSKSKKKKKEKKSNKNSEEVDSDEKQKNEGDETDD